MKEKNIQQILRVENDVTLEGFSTSREDSEGSNQFIKSIERERVRDNKLKKKTTEMMMW
jgi:hypothetical protein